METKFADTQKLLHAYYERSDEVYQEQSWHPTRDPKNSLNISLKKVDFIKALWKIAVLQKGEDSNLKTEEYSYSKEISGTEV